ncbi:MAG: molybdate ABC transporter substrate-binding protein [Saprospiraceae bacterium]
MKRISQFSGLFFFGLFAFSCGGSQSNQSIDLTVAVAANAQFAMEAIETAFEKETNKNIEIVIGSSGKLTAQIKQGAPYDMLVAANMKYPNYLYEEGLAKELPAIYALGELVLWTTKNDVVLTNDLTFLKNTTIQKIALANPKNAPYGEQAINALNFYELEETLTSKLVFAESIAQTNQYITTRNCEVGFTAKSVVLAPKLKDTGKWITVPKMAYQAIEQGVVITKYGSKEHPEVAQAFYQFLFSTTAQRIFQDYGYTIPN